MLDEVVATAREIVEGMKLGANHLIGTVSLADLVGLDVCLSVIDVFSRDLVSIGK